MDIITIMAMISLLVVALAFSPLGLGGGVLYVPIFYYMLDWEMKEAVIGSLTLVLMVSIGSSLAHSKAGYSDKNVLNLLREIDFHLYVGLVVVSACRKAVISDKSYYWRKKFGGLSGL